MRQVFITFVTYTLLGFAALSEERPLPPTEAGMKLWVSYCLQRADDLPALYRYLLSDSSWLETDAGWFQAADIALDVGIILTDRSEPDCVVVFQPSDGIETARKWFLAWVKNIDPAYEVAVDDRYRIKVRDKVFDLWFKDEPDTGLVFLTSRSLN